jgi:hypothetical protein
MLKNQTPSLGNQTEIDDSNYETGNLVHGIFKAAEIKWRK